MYEFNNVHHYGLLEKYKLNSHKGVEFSTESNERIHMPHAHTDSTE